MTFGVGEISVFKSFKITADSITTSNGDSFLTPKSGNVFVGVHFTIENTSDKDVAISTILLFNTYTDGVKNDYSVTANAAFSEGTLDGTISPGKKMVGYYAVEVPATWSELEFQVSPEWLSSSQNAAAFIFRNEPIE